MVGWVGRRTGESADGQMGRWVNGLVGGWMDRWMFG